MPCKIVYYVILPAFLSLVLQVNAKLPLHLYVPSRRLKKSDGITFDPLGVIAILGNPRASASAARLYTQPDKHSFRWPHALQMGAALTPISMLVRHLAANFKTVHPAVDMCKENMVALPVKANIVEVGLFDELLISSSNQWLSDALRFHPSENPINDMNIVYIHTMYGTGVFSDRSSGSADQKLVFQWPNHWRPKLEILAIHLTELVMGLGVFVAAVFSALLGDIWAVALLFIYALHWVASSLVSTTRIVIPDPALRVVSDQRIEYAVYWRPEGGSIIFKGRRDILERWARTRWVLNKPKKGGLWIKTFHWVWILSGSAAAFASVICMANMSGILQLCFLGMLLYGSLAEIWLTRLAGRLQRRSHEFGDSQSISNNDKRYKSIIQATIGVKMELRLVGLPWIELGLLPGFPEFRAMLRALNYLNQQDATIDKAQQEFNAVCPIHPGLSGDVWAEIERVWKRTATAHDLVTKSTA